MLHKQMESFMLSKYSLNTLKPKQYGRHFPDENYKCIFLKIIVFR